MKTREETKQALRRALAEHESTGHYLSMVECAFGVDGLTELTDTFMMLLDQVPEACKPAVSKDGRSVALGRSAASVKDHMIRLRKNGVDVAPKTFLKDVHGTYSRYVSGCRCSECKRAMSAYYLSLKNRTRESA